MARKIRTAIWVGTSLSLLGAVGLAVVAIRDNTALRLELANSVRLSTDECRLLVSDLESPEPGRIVRWSLYFRHHLDRASNSNGAPRSLAELYDLYEKRERPGRSNYFTDLLFALSAKEQSQGLTKKELIGFLGEPDACTNGMTYESLRYGYSWYGRDSVALITVSNQLVVGIGFQANTRK